jgi:GNAT superfamily N-acetyltransferase
MACRYVVATEKELDLLVQMRIEFVQDLHPEYDEKRIESIRAGTEAYIHGQAATGNYVGFFGLDTDACRDVPIPASNPIDSAECISSESISSESISPETIACTGALLVYTLPPLHGQEGRKIGHVLNFYTRKGFRRKGYGRELMAFMIAYAKEHGFNRLFLNATEDGAPLYRKAGYQEVKDAMSLELKQ